MRQVSWDSFLQVVSVWVNIGQIFSHYPYKTLIETKLEMEIALRDRCYPVNLLHIFRTSFHKNTSGRLLLMLAWNKIKRLNDLKLYYFPKIFEAKMKKTITLISEKHGGWRILLNERFLYFFISSLFKYR